MSVSPLIQVNRISHRYGDLTALREISLNVNPKEIYGLLGPNGGGKSTFFKILSTMMLPSEGDIAVGGYDVKKYPDEVRAQLGVIFQHPSVDEQLTVYENLKYHGLCYGVRGDQLRERAELLISQLGLSGRENDRAENLSGGLKRRVEIAKGLIAEPKILLMDEPSTGLDPVARRDLWDLIKQLNRDEDITFIVTTHIMEEAENCSRIGILDRGVLVAEGTPNELKSEIGGDMIEIQTQDAEQFAQDLQTDYQISPQIVQQTVRFEQQDGHHFIPQLVEHYPGRVDGITVRKPTLEDVFVYQTGHAFGNGEARRENLEEQE